MPTLLLLDIYWNLFFMIVYFEWRWVFILFATLLVRAEEYELWNNIKEKKSEKKIPLYLSIVHQIVFQIYENLSHKMYIIAFMMFSSLLGIMFHITDIFLCTGFLLWSEVSFFIRLNIIFFLFFVQKIRLGINTWRESFKCTIERRSLSGLGYFWPW